ncbi:hypothetical protein KAX06_05075 [candidate division WOR-3 bacterium]|nr:hypothetical protein [candidate division WOR-3 bacterium]
MRKILFVLLTALVVIPVTLLGQQLGERVVTGKAIIESKPKAFYYEIDPYQPIGILLGANRFILDPNLITQVEMAVGRSTFMADPYLLRIPVQIPRFYNLDHEVLSVETAPYQERGVGEWEVQILDARGSTFRTLQGKGSLPASISWDGRGDELTEVMRVGDVYSYIIILTMKDGSRMRKIGRPIDLNGIAYDSVVAVKESEIATYDPIVSEKIARYYQYVLNRFKEKGFSRIRITASDSYIADIAQRYLSERLYHTEITVVENPEYARVEFIFQ